MQVNQVDFCRSIYQTSAAATTLLFYQKSGIECEDLWEEAVATRTIIRIQMKIARAKGVEFAEVAKLLCRSRH